MQDTIHEVHQPTSSTNKKRAVNHAQNINFVVCVRTIVFAPMSMIATYSVILWHGSTDSHGLLCVHSLSGIQEEDLSCAHGYLP